jgi:hypothetical protein
MSWDFRIVSPVDAVPLTKDCEHIPRTPLRPFREIYDWIAQRATDWAKHEDPDCLRVRIGPNAGCTIHLKTVRCREMADDAIRRDVDFRSAMDAFVPGDDEPVTELFVICRGSGPCDYTLLAECAAWLGAVVQDCSGDKFETPEEWLTRERAKAQRRRERAAREGEAPAEPLR